MPINPFEHVQCSESHSQDVIERTTKAIAAWEAETPGVVSQAVGVVLSPLTWLVGKLIPHVAIEGVLSGVDWAAKHITTTRGEGDLDNLSNCNAYADRTINVHIGLAIAEGGAAGFFGAIALPLDIPAVILLALRLIRQIGVEYGYEGLSDDDRAFVLSILSASGANSQNEKVEAIAFGSMLLNKIAKNSWKAMASKATTSRFGLDAGIIATKNLAKSLGINITKRKALAVIPVIGAVVGGSANGWYLREVGIAAQHSFQKRWLLDRGHLIETGTSVDLEANVAPMLSEPPSASTA